MSWTQALCRNCWPAYALGSRGEVTRAAEDHIGPEETCCVCGSPTISGIYIRADPKVVPYPKEEA